MITDWSACLFKPEHLSYGVGAPSGWRHGEIPELDTRGVPGMLGLVQESNPNDPEFGHPVRYAVIEGRHVIASSMSVIPVQRGAAYARSDYLAYARGVALRLLPVRHDDATLLPMDGPEWQGVRTLADGLQGLIALPETLRCVIPSRGLDAFVQAPAATVHELDEAIRLYPEEDLRNVLGQVQRGLWDWLLWHSAGAAAIENAKMGEPA